jgi:hypothetical protein
MLPADERRDNRRPPDDFPRLNVHNCRQAKETLLEIATKAHQLTVDTVGAQNDEKEGE